MLDITSKPGSSKVNKTGGWRTFIPKTDFKKCIGCGACVKTCPENAIKMIKRKKSPLISKEGSGVVLKPKTDYNFCKGCGLCAKHCPVKAITMNLDKK